VWVSGETNRYRNWDAGEPNNSNGNEDYTEIKANGRWNDVAGVGDHFGIVEILSRLTNGVPTLTIGKPGEGVIVEISWQSATNQLYQILSAPEVTREGWSSFGTYIYGNGTIIQLLTAMDRPQRFYKVFPVQ